MSSSDFPNQKAWAARRVEVILVSGPFLGTGNLHGLLSLLDHGQNALFTVPPSTRSAAPVVAEDSGLAM